MLDKQQEEKERAERELEDNKAKAERLRKLLEQQDRRIKRKEELEEMKRVSKEKVKKLKEQNGNVYKYQVMEDDYHKNVVMPEIERQKQLVDEQREKHRK